MISIDDDDDDHYYYLLLLSPLLSLLLYIKKCYIYNCVYVYNIILYIMMANKMMGNDDENILWVNPQSWLIMVNNGNHLLNLWMDNSWSYHFRLVKIKSYGSWLMVVILPAKIIANNGLPSSTMANAW